MYLSFAIVIHTYLYIHTCVCIHTYLGLCKFIEKNLLLMELLVDHSSIDNLDHLFSAILNSTFQDRLTNSSQIDQQFKWELQNIETLTWNRMFDFQLQILCGTRTDHSFIYVHKIHCLFFSACAISSILVTYNLTSNLLTVKDLNKNGCCWNNATSFGVTDDHQPPATSDDLFCMLEHEEWFSPIIQSVIKSWLLEVRLQESVF